MRLCLSLPLTPLRYVVIWMCLRLPCFPNLWCGPCLPILKIRTPLHLASSLEAIRPPGMSVKAVLGALSRVPRLARGPITFATAPAAALSELPDTSAQNSMLSCAWPVKSS